MWISSVSASPQPRFAALLATPWGVLLAAFLLQLPLSLNPGYFSHDELQWAHFAQAGVQVPASAVKEGKVSLTLPNGEELLVGAGETGYASPDGSDLYMLGLPPVFLDQDPYLREMNVDPVSCRAQ